MEVLAVYKLSGGQVLKIGRGDLTAEAVDAIVNAANEYLQHGGGVAGAIRRRGGESIQQDSNLWVKRNGPVRTGTAVITAAGDLPAEYVIHAVGPVWGSGQDAEKLASAVTMALALAEDYHLTSIAIPGISSGIFGGPKDVCARIILQATVDYLARHPVSSLREVRFCNIDQPTIDAFLTEAKTVMSEESNRSQRDDTNNEN
jgi:putative ATPase